MRTLLCLLAVALPGVAETFTGTLLPQKCRNDDPATHTLECSLRCAASGLGMVLESGDYLPFANSSQEQALGFLKSLAKQADLRIRVNGKLERKSIVIESIELDESPRKTAILRFDGVQIIGRGAAGAKPHRGDGRRGLRRTGAAAGAGLIG